MQALAFAGSFHFAKSGPPPSYRDARSRDRERGLSKLSGVDELYMYMFILRDPIGSFSDWQRYGPARAHSGAPLLPSLGRQGQSAPCNIIARLCVCLSVSSINA